MPNTSDRIAILARQKHPIFHAKDLARLWQIENLNSLYTLLKRYTKRKLLFRVYKGLYSLLPIGELDPMLLGVKALHSYAYVSTETILVKEGIIAQIVYDYTFISDHSRRFQIGTFSFTSRKLKDEYLYNSAGIYEEDGVLKATTERAVADLLYFNPKAYLDGIKMIDFEKVQSLQKEIGYPQATIPHASTL